MFPKRPLTGSAICACLKNGHPMPKSRSRRNFYHLDGMDLFLTAAGKECSCFQSPKD